jgi:hypothetical protein
MMSNYCPNGHWEDGLKLPCKQCEIESLRQQLQQVTNAGIKEVDVLRQQLADMKAYNATRTDELLAATRQLAECERNANEQAQTLHNTICSANRLSEQLASVTKDAGRYRWLRENSNNVNYCLLCGYDGLACYEADDLDLQIDVAMKELATAGTAAQVGAGKTGEGS